MSQLANTNQACCSLPPVVQEGYVPKGEWEEIAGMKAYIVGDKSSKKALVAIYDIFGYFPQTQQGADLLASQGYRVVMPDFFRGEPFPLEKFPDGSGSEESKKNGALLQSFFANAGLISVRLPELIAVATELRKSGHEKVGVYGLCWGAKVAVTSGSVPGVFDAVVQIHPAMLSADDGEKLLVPVGSFISMHEPVDVFDKFIENANQKPFKDLNSFKVYSNMHHGFGGARADLSNPDNFKAFEDVYTKAANFFAAAL
ncbi:hypothetical protein HK098_004403 [Nowakowskiella sp. JEL0407]|nr:hypothetical protein HK098_004403 [Nowakowskiella sp. JEL0407]